MFLLGSYIEDSLNLCLLVLCMNVLCGQWASIMSVDRKMPDRCITFLSISQYYDIAVAFHEMFFM